VHGMYKPLFAVGMIVSQYRRPRKDWAVNLESVIKEKDTICNSQITSGSTNQIGATIF
jgi:hypothetical protein